MVKMRHPCQDLGEDHSQLREEEMPRRYKLCIKERKTGAFGA